MNRVKCVAVRRSKQSSLKSVHVKSRSPINYRVTSEGDVLYISEERNEGLNKMYPANLKKMKAIICDNNAQLKVDVDNLSKTQFGNVIKALDLIDEDGKRVHLSRTEEKGKSFFVAELK